MAIPSKSGRKGKGISPPQELARLTGLQPNISPANLNTCRIQPEALQLIPESMARKYNTIPLAIINNGLWVAMANASELQILEALAAQTQMRIEPVIATAEDIQRAIDRNYKAHDEIERQVSVAPSPPPTGEGVSAEASMRTAKEAAEILARASQEAISRAEEVGKSAKEAAETLKRVFEEAMSKVEGISKLDNETVEAITEAPKEIPHEDEGIKLEQLLADQEGIVAQGQAAVNDSQLNISPANLNIYQIQPEALQLIPESMARKYNAIPLAITDNTLQVAMADADDVLTLQALAAWTQMRIEPVIAAAEDIQRAIDRNYKAYGEIERQFSVAPTPPPTEEMVSAETIAEAPAVRALGLTIDEAIKKRASDIHIEPTEDRLRLRYRIDGVLHDTMSLPLSAHAPLISRLKILANMNIADHRPQDGQFSVKLRDKEVDVRVATIRTAYGEMGVLRILDKSFAALTLGELGFSPKHLKQYQQMLKFPFGMILISGPTGSGKTTTLYASVNTLDCEGRNIITVEDPVEYRFKDINQIQVNPRAGLTFATGLRAIARHDPDVILVGEIRDSETAELATQASLTGHLVLSSVHANDTVGALFRLLDLGVGPFVVSSALIGVVAQRMVRRICPYCRRPFQAPAEGQLAYCKELGEERTEFFYGSGCNSCANTGYLGRIAVFETLAMSEEIKGMLLTGAHIAQIRAQAKKEGMVSMWRDGMLKVKAGITTPCEVLRNVSSIG